MSYVLLHPEDIRDLVTMDEAIGAMESAYGDIAEWPLISRPRQRVHSPNNVRLSTFSGGCQSMGVIGIAEHAERLSHGDDVQKSEGRENQVWILHDSNTGALLAIMVGVINEKHLGRIPRTRNTQVNPTQTSLRTGATSGVGYKYMARHDARVAGVLGAGNQAITQLQALKAVRPIEKVRVYSPTRENREDFAAKIGAFLELDIEPVDSAEKAVRGVDVLIAATNSNVPVFSGDWLEPGQHVSSIVGSNAALVTGGWLKTQRRELDDATITRANVIVANSRDSVMQEQQGDLFLPIEAGLVKLESIAELGEVVRGLRPGRNSPDEITLHKNNNGLGPAEMALAKLAYDKALAAGRGIRMELASL
jgi:alanine dehydrogenase